MASAALASPAAAFLPDGLSHGTHGEMTYSAASSSSSFSSIPSRDGESIQPSVVSNDASKSVEHSRSSAMSSRSKKFSSPIKSVSKNLLALDLSSPFIPVRPLGGSSVASSVRRKDIINRCDSCLAKPVPRPAVEPVVAPNISDMVVHPMQPSSQWTLPPGTSSASSPNPQGGEITSLPTANEFSNALVLHSSSEAQHQHRIPMDPSEVIRGGCGSNGRDPPGESPTARPMFQISQCHGGRLIRNVQWVDPKTITNQDEIDHGVLDHYERLTGCYNSTLHTIDPLIKVKSPDNRIRIATISSGYKKANFFVREDLDQRIYFHDLEDAVSYMARRGYSRMKKEEEKEWMKLLGRAHQVVKVGPTKKKQRYRKGKLVLIMSKQIVESEPSYYSSSKSNPSSETSTAATSHTSVGRSVRGPFKSYSEKFLAEQEREKRLLLTEEAPRLLLMNGPVDPEPSKLLQLTYGEDMNDDVEDKSRSTASKKSSNASGSQARMVNYRGGVRYFTPDNVKSYDDDSEDEEEGVGEEEEESTPEVGHSDDSSMLSESFYSKDDEVVSEASSGNSEVSFILRQPQGVQMASKYDSKNTLNQRRAPTPCDKKVMSRKNRSSSPPDMAPISDNSEASSQSS